MSQLNSETFSDDEQAFLKEAALFFKSPGLFARGLNWVGRPLELAEKQLPEKVRQKISQATQRALQEALKYSIKTVRSASGSLSDLPVATKHAERSSTVHSGLAALVGGVGGFLGLATLPVELTLSTGIILRSIAEIARQYGSDLESVEGRLECLYVFGLGVPGAPESGDSPTRKRKGDSPDFVYYSSRVEFAQLLRGASSYIAANSAKDVLAALEKGTAPTLVKLIARVAARFEIQITDKFFAQAVPVAGALGGAAFNLMFTNYYNQCAKYHFGIKKIERERGLEATQALFESYLK